MDPGTGNIYTREQAEKLGLDFEDLIPMTDEEAESTLEARRAFAYDLREAAERVRAES